ncbi:hypothetical protein MXB_4584 [Myxobolus squamalis]|nr:hypothetical protein MXB_4584 [Myxobolus squamalis]
MAFGRMWRARLNEAVRYLRIYSVISGYLYAQSTRVMVTPLLVSNSHALHLSNMYAYLYDKDCKTQLNQQPELEVSKMLELNSDEFARVAPDFS